MSSAELARTAIELTSTSAELLMRTAQGVCGCCKAIGAVQAGLKFAARGACMAAVYTATAPVGIAATVGTVALGALAGQALCGNVSPSQLEHTRVLGYIGTSAAYGAIKGYELGGVIGAVGGGLAGLVTGTCLGIPLGYNTVGW